MPDIEYVLPQESALKGLWLSPVWHFRGLYNRHIYEFQSDGSFSQAAWTRYGESGDFEFVAKWTGTWTTRDDLVVTKARLSDISWHVVIDTTPSPSFETYWAFRQVSHEKLLADLVEVLEPTTVTSAEFSKIASLSELPPPTVTVSATGLKISDLPTLATILSAASGPSNRQDRSEHGRQLPDREYVGFDASELVGSWVRRKDTNEPCSCVFRPDGAFELTSWHRSTPGPESPGGRPGHFRMFASWTGSWAKENDSLRVEYSLSELSVEARRSVNPRRGIIRERWQLRSIARGCLSADICDLALGRPVPRELQLRRVADISEFLRSLEVQERRSHEDRLKLAIERLEALSVRAAPSGDEVQAPLTPPTSAPRMRGSVGGPSQAIREDSGEPNPTDRTDAVGDSDGREE